MKGDVAMANLITLVGSFDTAKFGFGVFRINGKLQNGSTASLTSEEKDLFINRKLKVTNYRQIRCIAPEKHLLHIRLDMDMLACQNQKQQESFIDGYDRLTTMSYNNYCSTCELEASAIYIEAKLPQEARPKPTNTVRHYWWY